MKSKLDYYELDWGSQVFACRVPFGGKRGFLKSPMTEGDPDFSGNLAPSPLPRSGKGDPDVFVAAFSGR